MKIEGLTVTSLTPGESFSIVELADMSFVPRNWSIALTNEELADLQLAVGTEMLFDINVIVTSSQAKRIAIQKAAKARK
jgi:hypothetical protein